MGRRCVIEKFAFRSSQLDVASLRTSGLALAQAGLPNLGNI